MDFKLIKNAVAAKFAELAKHELYRTGITKDKLWDTYLASFPAGSNPIYKTRTEHDCQCCKQFIRAVGDVVSIIDGKVVSIWDCEVGEPNYQAVCDAMAAAVKEHPIEDVFLHYEKTAGTEKSLQDTLDGIVTWNHFHVHIPAKFVVTNGTIGSQLNEVRTAREVMARGLNDLTIEALDTVLELIQQNSLYRGEEHKHAVQQFRELKQQYDRSTNPLAFTWVKVKEVHAAVARFRNTSIGTLVTALSEGKDLEAAVKSFEEIVAPANYKRPTALVTPAMIAKAKETITELGLTSALERRYAKLGDITINNVLFADRSAQKAMKGDVFDALAASVPVKAQSFDKVEEVPIDKFISDILPKAKSLEIMVENRHTGNLVSLIAPADPTALPLFKWGNNFSWSYNGDVADSMRERVVKAGGRVDGVLRFTHSWNHIGRNASLMDLHVFLPGSSPHKEGCHNQYPDGQRVGWNNRNDWASRGVQDVDYVDAAPVGYVPIENITFPSLQYLKEGRYTFKIHNWSLRAPTDSGFKAEIELNGEVFEYEYLRPLKDKEWVTVAEATLKNGHFSIEHKIPHGAAVRQTWSVNTQNFHKVTALMMSPNFWDGQLGIGNKHYFFMLDGCRNEGTARGFYNEFLKADLDKHRKVIEMVGAKMRTEEAEHQLSGLGFSSTQRNSVLCKVEGTFTRVVKIVF
jgi:hypothetical protein